MLYNLNHAALSVQFLMNINNLNNINITPVICLILKVMNLGSFYFNEVIVKHFPN
jgi:hypothetical protein